jgi:hypothetical protein
LGLLCSGLGTITFKAQSLYSALKEKDKNLLFTQPSMSVPFQWWGYVHLSIAAGRGCEFASIQGVSISFEVTPPPTREDLYDGTCKKTSGRDLSLQLDPALALTSAARRLRCRFPMMWKT